MLYLQRQINLSMSKAKRTSAPTRKGKRPINRQWSKFLKVCSYQNIYKKKYEAKPNDYNYRRFWRGPRNESQHRGRVAPSG